MSAFRCKSWREKLADDKDLPKVIPITGKLRRSWGEGTCVIPAPGEVDGLMRRIPRGRVALINDLREALAERHGATIGCPITTGIFAWMAAHAAEEARAAGRIRVNPWWRTLKQNGELNPKYPGGAAAQARLLRAEGHRILRGRGRKPPRVAEVDLKRASPKQLLRKR